MPELGPRELLTLWEAGSTQDPLRRAVILLTAARGGSAAEAATVDIGTRDVLLAGLFRLLAGDQVPACADCPGCGVVLEAPVDVAAVAALPVHEPRQCMTVRMDGAEVPFRLPTTADLIALGGCPPGQARAALLAACLGLEPETTPGAETEAAVETAMAQTAPAGAIDLLVRCPACGLDSSLPLDMPVLLWAEIEAQAAALMRDVHALGTSYGWTEEDVLGLSPRRRAIYLDLAG